MMRAGCLISMFPSIRVMVILGAELKAMTKMLKDLVMIGKFYIWKVVNSWCGEKEITE